jgi:hypothetical protein
MADLIVITPSRGRPARLREMVEAVHSTAGGAVGVVVGLDLDDPMRDEYTDAPVGCGGELSMILGERKSLSGWTNYLANLVLDDSPDAPRYLASFGDDHRPRTPGWDLKLIEAIEQMPGPGFAYGNDLLQGKAMPTAWVVSAEVVRALGWMMLPTLAHMYVDNAILTLGTEAARIAYRPDVVIEHVHPLAGKTSWDDSYRESNADERYVVDRAAFEAWQRGGQMAADIATVEALVYEGRVTG